MAKLIGASLGPGDPELITRKAWAAITSAGCWAYPVRREGVESYALAIALNAGLTLPEDAMALVFPMTHDKEILAKYWLRAAERVVEILKQGRDVVFLVEGDASTYSTFGHLARTVRALDDSVEVETIAGVTSFNAAAASLEIPLADVDDTLAVIPAGYGIEVIDHMLDEFDTLVLLKVKPLLEDIIALLERRGLLAHARFIEKAGSPQERIVLDVASLRDQKVNYLSLIMVHNPNRQRGEMIRGCRNKSSSEEMVS